MGTTNSAGRSTLLAVSLGSLVIALLGVGTAAQASTLSTSPSASQACSVDLSTQEVICVPLGEDLNRAVLAETHTTVVVPDGAVGARAQTLARTAGTATTYIIAQFFSYPSYGGSMILQVTNPAPCNGSVIQLTNFANYGADNDADSFKSYAGCQTKIWDGPNLSGASFGYRVDAPDVGSSMRNRASSAQFK